MILQLHSSYLAPDLFRTDFFVDSFDTILFQFGNRELKLTTQLRVMCLPSQEKLMVISV